MADYAISNVPRRVVYAASGTGPYAFTFEVLSASDIAVYKGDTLLTLTTDYTVSIAANGTGTVTLVATAGTSNITIVGAKTIARTTDFTTGGDFFANTLNDELDAQTIFIQQVAETAERGLKAPVTDPTDINMTLPRKDNRKGKVLSFDATTGAPIASFEAGDIANAQGYATAAAASAAAALSSQSTASSAASSATASASTATTKAAEASASALAAATAETNAETAETNAEAAQALAEAAKTAAEAAQSAASGSASSASSSAATATTQAGIATTKAGEASASALAAASSETNAAASAAAAASALDNFDDRYLGSKTADPTLDNDGDALVTGALYYRTTAPIGMKVYDGAQWIAASSASQAILTTYKYTATAGQTTFSGLDDNGLTLGYTVGSVLITVNGLVYEIGTDVTASTGNSIVLAAGAVLNDEVNIYSFADFLVANTYTRAEADVLLAAKQDYDVDTAKTDVVQSFSKAQRGAIVALTDGATITPDFSLGNNYSVTLGGNRTLANPTNLTAGQSGVIVVTQDGTGSRTLAYGSYFKFPAGTAPSLTTTASAVDVLAYYVESSTRITARLVADVK